MENELKVKFYNSNLSNPIDLIAMKEEGILKDYTYTLFEKRVFGLFENAGFLETATSVKNKDTDEHDIPIDKVIGSDVVYFKPWKNVLNISARLIESYDDIVVLECLVDKENFIYEERDYKSTLFEGFDINKGNLFYLRFFERQNESRMEVHDGTKLVPESDFKKLDYTERFKSSKLFK